MIKMKKLMFVFPLNKIKSSTIRQRRGVSDIIVTLLLMSITIIGGVLVFSTFSGEGGIVEELGSDVAPTTAPQLDVKLIGYDTRDFTGLSGISFISNSNPVGTALTDGEYIILKIRNPNNAPITILEVTVNEEIHTFAAGGVSGSIKLSANLPTEGTFEVFEPVDITAPDIFTPAVVQPGADAKIIISLENDLADIELYDVMRISINVVGLDLINFKVLAGATS